MSNIVHNTLPSNSLIVSKATLRRTRAPNKTAVVELNYDWLNCFTPANPRLRSRSPRLGSRNVQSRATAFYLNPGLGDRDWERS